MKIAIDARFYGVTGIGRYLSNLISNLEKVNTVHDVDIYLKSSNYDTYVPGNDRFSKKIADAQWYSFKEQVLLPLALYKQNYDLVHFPHINVPIFYFRPFVVTIHDLIMHGASKGATTRLKPYFYLKKAVYTFVVSWAAKRAKRIIVPTHQVKEEIITQLHVPEAKVVVTYEAVDEVFFTVSEEVAKDSSFVHDVLEKYSIQKPYFMFLSSFYEHKNHKVLINAFKTLIDEGFRVNGKEPLLVLVGKQDRFAEKTYDYITSLGLSERIVLPGRSVSDGYVPDKDAIALLSGATLFICPSKKEGFGINFLEAMALGIPVVLSNASCLPEVGGDAAIYFDPDSQEELVTVIKKVLDAPELIAGLKEKGLARARQFSWERMAQETLDVYESTQASS